MHLSARAQHAAWSATCRWLLSTWSCVVLRCVGVRWGGVCRRVTTLAPGWPDSCAGSVCGCECPGVQCFAIIQLNRASLQPPDQSVTLRSTQLQHQHPHRSFPSIILVLKLKFRQQNAGAVEQGAAAAAIICNPLFWQEQAACGARSGKEDS